MTTTLDELERLHAAATPGEWEHEDVRNYGWEVNCDEQESHIATCGIGSFSEANAAAIVAAHNAFPALLAYVRALEAVASYADKYPVTLHDQLDAARAKLNGGK